MSQFLHSGHLIRQCVVAHIPVTHVMKFLGSPWRAHSIEFDDDEAEFGKRLSVAVRSREVARPQRGSMDGRVNIIDDGILLAGIEVRGSVHQTVDVGHAIASFNTEWDRRLPPGGEQGGNVGCFESAKHLSIRIA